MWCVSEIPAFMIIMTNWKVCNGKWHCCLNYAVLLIIVIIDFAVVVTFMIVKPATLSSKFSTPGGRRRYSHHSDMLVLS